MLDTLNDILIAAAHAASLILRHTAEVNPWLLALGTVLYIASQAIRTRGWHTIIKAAYPDSDLQPRHTMTAYLAGSGLNAVIPARGGDAVKLALIRRRIDGSSYVTLAGTFVPETVFETLFGTALVVWALTQGFLPVPTSSGELPAIDVTFVIRHPFLSAGATAGIVALVLLIGRTLRRGATTLLERFRAGLAIFGTPRRFISGVASWQALARLVRLGSLAAFMGAFSLPVTVTTVVLVMAAQGGGRIIPLAPASAGLRLAMLSYGFVETTGQAVDIGQITAFTFGVGTVLMLSGLLIATAIVWRELGTLNPRNALRAARDALSHERPAPASPVAEAAGARSSDPATTR
ncbi:MAG: flippase-like protein [Solirubrobacterales bacterium]|nr:flippase-like protein [Solirubrobacterales bacterium]